MYQVKIKVMPEYEIELPEKMSEGASGFDLRAAIDTVIMPREWLLVPTGISISMPVELEAQLRPRSGLSFKHGITLLNSPGTIDADYRGEIKVILLNMSRERYQIQKNDRIAQLVFQEVPKVQLELVEELDVTVRGAGGFGHTGKR